MKRYLLYFLMLLIAALLSPIVIALFGMVLSPILSTIGYLAVIFVITVIIAYKNRNRKR